MTASQIVIEVVIGVALIVVGVFLRGPLERFHEFTKRPAAITPQTRGQWTQYLASAKLSLERINYLNAHPRDLYLYLLQVIFAALVFDGLAFIILV